MTFVYNVVLDTNYTSLIAYRDCGNSVSQIFIECSGFGMDFREIAKRKCKRPQSLL